MKKIPDPTIVRPSGLDNARETPKEKSTPDQLSVDKTPNKLLTGLRKYVEFIFLFIFSIIGLSYLSAAILGFPGIRGPINALTDKDIGHLIAIFAIMLVAIIWINVKQGTSWKAVKNIWLRPGCIITAIYIILITFYPGIDESLVYRKINKIQQTGLYAKVPDGTKAYIENDEGFFIPSKKRLDKDTNYPIIHGNGFKKDGDYKLIAIMLPDKNGEFTKKATIGWIRVDEGGTDKGIKIISRADLYVKASNRKPKQAKSWQTIWGPKEFVCVGFTGGVDGKGRIYTIPGNVLKAGYKIIIEAESRYFEIWYSGGWKKYKIVEIINKNSSGRGHIAIRGPAGEKVITKVERRT